MPADRLPVFRVEHLSKRFPLPGSLLSRLLHGRRFLTAVDDISFEIAEREVFGIIGESGSGKSTLALMLAEIEDATAGRIAFRGTPVRSMDAGGRRRFRQKVQVVFQDSASSLNPRRRVGSAVRDALRLRGVPRAARPAELVRLFNIVGLQQNLSERFPHQLSGGQRQRVGIARALAMKPEVIIADEPVSALDVSLQGQIINLLLQLNEDLGLTIVLVSHDIAVVRQTSSRIAVMFAGKIVEAGDAADVVGDPKHPYTVELIAAVPKGLRGADGSAGPAVAAKDIDIGDTAGCVFAGRCPRVEARCRDEPPRSARLSATRLVLCHLYAPGESR